MKKMRESPLVRKRESCKRGTYFWPIIPDCLKTNLKKKAWCSFHTEHMQNKYIFRYHFLMASVAEIPDPDAVVHPMAKLSPWLGLSEGKECRRSFSLARLRASFLASKDISSLLWIGGEKWTDRSLLWTVTISSMNCLSMKRFRINMKFLNNLSYLLWLGRFNRFLAEQKLYYIAVLHGSNCKVISHCSHHRD